MSAQPAPPPSARAHPTVTPRRRLLRWGSWFAVVNAALLSIVGLRYLWYYAGIAPGAGWIYAVLAYVGHLSLLAFVPFLLLVPMVLLVPLPRLVLSLGVVLASIEISLLVLDTLVFAENRYHLNTLTFTMLERQTWAFLVLYFLLGLAIEAMLARWIWIRTAQPPSLRIGWWVALGLGTCVVASHLIHALAVPHYYVPVTAFTRYLPLYHPLRDTGLLVKLGIVDRNRAREEGMIAAVNRPSGRVLSYPLAPLQCEPPKPALNVLLVVIDALRADAVTPDLAPRLSHFKQSAIAFDAHYSGGNSSRAGMFSIFYGLPGTYWEDFANFARTPVLMDLFRKYNYELGLFASAPLYRQFLGLDRTALARIPNLRLETSSSLPGSSGWDRTVTDEWYGWLSKRDPSRPFFGFLYYDAVVSSDPPPNYPPAVRVPPGASRQVLAKARYLTAVHFDDALVGDVLDDLERRKLLQSTIIIVTSDHGMEFNENGLGFTGHGTAFSDIQLHTPLLVHWPGRPPGRVLRRTSHNDLAPTLVSELFRCTNPPSDYASGHSLFSDAQWDWLIAASYTDFALLQPDQVTIVYPAGYEVRDREYRLIPRPAFPQDALRAALREMRRFYQ